MAKRKRRASKSKRTVVPLGLGLSKAGCSHRGQAVKAGPYEILAGGTRYLQSEDFGGVDLVIPLTNDLSCLAFGGQYQVLPALMRDFGGVPEGWSEFLEQRVIPELEAGRRLLAYCIGSHGRTGTFLASLIALLESAEETPDPIEAARERHCSHAVETLMQAEAIFALRGQKLPARYRREFYTPPSPKWGWPPTGGRIGGVVSGW
jgi:hypothetical protein